MKIVSENQFSGKTYFYTIANSALDHDFFWSDPMPVSLDKMLSQHTQSMFEFLAPRRMSGAAAAAAAAGHRYVILKVRLNLGIKFPRII